MCYRAVTFTLSVEADDWFTVWQLSRDFLITKALQPFPKCIAFCNDLLPGVATVAERTAKDYITVYLDVTSQPIYWLRFSNKDNLLDTEYKGKECTVVKYSSGKLEPRPNFSCKAQAHCVCERSNDKLNTGIRQFISGFVLIFEFENCHKRPPELIS